jgi:hypothetical protein
MSSVRFASAAVNSWAASIAVLRFEPTATMPPSTAATATATIDGRIELDRADNGGDENHAAAHHGDPAGQDEFAAAFDPSDELIDLRLEPHDLVAMVAVVHGVTHAGRRSQRRARSNFQKT